jgi:hypothetical protein
MDEPILIVEAADAGLLWDDDGRWMDLEPVSGSAEADPAERKGLDRWRAGISTVLTLAVTAGIFAFGLTPVRTADAPAAPPPPAVPAGIAETHRAMFARIVELEEANQALYRTIETTRRQLAGIGMLRAHLEATEAPAAGPVLETADARQP